uniref:RNase H type-1 domain-containing protein n=1 Tax=Poecilia mexicana TaxID=48701 RepID=A0A3B3YYQ3_9TELE
MTRQQALSDSSEGARSLGSDPPPRPPAPLRRRRSRSACTAPIPRSRPRRLSWRLTLAAASPPTCRRSRPALRESPSLSHWSKPPPEQAATSTAEPPATSTPKPPAVVSAGDGERKQPVLRRAGGPGQPFSETPRACCCTPTGARPHRQGPGGGGTTRPLLVQATRPLRCRETRGGSNHATLINGNPNKFKGPLVPLSGLGGNVIFGKAVKLPLKIGQLPIAEYTALVTPVKEWIIGMDVLAGMTLHLQQGKFEFGVPRPLQMKSVLVGKVKMPPFPIPLATQMVSMKQYQIPGGQEEISATIKDYVAAGVLKKCTTSWNNPIWPVRKSDGTWRMTVDYRQLNKHTPPLTSAVPDIISIIERFICLFGYWRNHIPHLGQILQPMYQVTRKKEEFTWGESQQRVFELAKEAIQQAVSLGKMMSGPVELQVSAVNDYGVHIFSDSWSVVNGLTTWVPTWKNNGWKIQNKEVWGKELWTEIWEKIQSIPVTITHVDAHTKSTEAEALHNRYIDGVFRAMQVARESSVGLARWFHPIRFQSLCVARTGSVHIQNMVFG